MEQKYIRTPALRRLNLKASLKFNRSIPSRVMDQLDPLANHRCFYTQMVDDHCIRTRWSLRLEGKKKPYYGEIDISPEDFKQLKGKEGALREERK